MQPFPPPRAPGCFILASFSPLTGETSLESGGGAHREL